MNPVQDHAVPDLIATVLACYRTPALHGEILRGDHPVPADIAVLFRLAGGGDSSDLGLQGFNERDLESLADAARFYIEQTLFRRDADHYRLLGLNPGAEDTQIKEHHRLLMRLFHPDRTPGTDDWKDSYVNRINHAYNALRDEATRRQYDADMASGRIGMARDQGNSRSHVVPGYRGDRREAYPPVPKRTSRRIPIYVMSAVALLALLFVGSVYIQNRPTQKHGMQLVEAAPSADHGSAKQQSTPGAARNEDVRMSPELEARLDDLLAMDQVAKARNEAYAKSAASSRDSHVRSKFSEADIKVADKTSTKAPASALIVPVPVAPAPPVQSLAPAVMPAPQPATSASTAASLRMTDGLKPGTQQVDPATTQAHPLPQAMLRQPEIAAVGIQAHELEKLLFRYVMYYERGDITGFMALFEEGARANAGGKAKIRQEYERFFKNSQMRNLDFGPANWKSGADISTAKIPYRVTIRSQGDSEAKVFSGVLFFEATKRGNDLLISALFDSSGDLS